MLDDEGEGVPHGGRIRHDVTALWDVVRAARIVNCGDGLP